ncbi:hypothetical protein [Sphingomonas sp. LT1P40]|uniref:hypothetical protein n=1 Tax=Alteristakelama amylovorans TaxID=3096166 RepID=UPI002FC8D7A4
MALPADRAVMASEEATVVSQAPGLQGRNGRSKVYATVRLRLNNGTPLTLGRAIECLPALKPGDRVRLSGTRNKAGAMMWYFKGEGCSR